VESFFLAVGPWPAHLVVVAAAHPLTVIDVREHRLPDRIVLPIFAGSAGYFFTVARITGDDDPWVRSAVVMAAAVVSLWLMAEAPGQPLGFGDVKLGGLLALHLGWHSGEAAVFGLAMAFICGGVWVVAGWCRRALGPGDQIAFGPWLIAGFLFALLAVVQSAEGGAVI